MARARAPPSRSSSAERMSRMSISMCEKEGVPSVITMWRACAASATRVAEAQAAASACTRSSSSCAPVSSNGMRPSRTAPRRRGSLSMPSTRRPRSAKRQRQRQPDAAEADDGDVGGALRGAHRSQRLAAPGVIVGRCGPLPGDRLRHGASRAGGARTGARSPRRSAGCSARSAATGGAARARAGRAHSRPVRCIHARRLRDEAGVEVEGRADADEQRRRAGAARIAGIHFSCLGWPVPTHTTCGAGARRCRRSLAPPRRRQRAERRRVAADDPQPGKRSRRRSSSSSSASGVRPP